VTATPERPVVEGRIHACVDVGSNSVHLLVASVLDGRLEVSVDDRSVFLGLGAAADGFRFGPEVRARLLETLAGYADLATGLGAETVTFVGTEPFRRAADAATVFGSLEAAGWPLHVVTHEEEALLTLLGATGGRPVEVETAVVDVGGGSSDLALVGPGHPAIALGIKAGSDRLTRALVAHDPPRRDEIEAIRHRARELFAAAPAAVVGDVIAVGGTAGNLVKVLASIDATDDGAWLTPARLDHAIDVLIGAPSGENAERFVLNPIRARLLPAGAAILEAILDRFGVEGLRAVEAGMREGTVLAIARAGIGWRDALPALAAGWEAGSGDSRDRPTGWV
jgi:exopolyphosphatase / guanosine-5'-triphosphate,3'-diphosphate pyrophosphatase